MLITESKDVTAHRIIIENKSVISKAKNGWIKKSGFVSKIGTVDKNGHSNIETPNDNAV